MEKNKADKWKDWRFFYWLSTVAWIIFIFGPDHNSMGLFVGAIGLWLAVLESFRIADKRS